MNSIIGGYLADSFFAEYQSLRNQLMEILGDEDLELRLGGGTMTLGVLCREIGEIEYSYVESFRTFRQDLSYRNPDPRLEHSVSALVAWYAELDRGMLAAIDALSEADIEARRIVRSDFDADFFAPLPKEQMDVYREALLIFYGKVSVYLRVLGKPIPTLWREWIS